MLPEHEDKIHKLIDLVLKQNEKKEVLDSINELTGEQNDFFPTFEARTIYYRFKKFPNYESFLEWQESTEIRSMLNSCSLQINGLSSSETNSEFSCFFTTSKKELL